MIHGCVDTLVFAAGSFLLVAAVRWWRPELPRRWATGHALLAFAFVAPALTTGWNQAPVDIAYQFRPWSAQAPKGFEVDNELLSDIPLQMVPFRTLVRDRLLSLEAPLWANELGTGQPLLGNAQSAPFAPLHLGTLMLPPVRALTVAAGWQLLLGALLVHALILGLARSGLARGPGEEPGSAPWPIEPEAPWPIQSGAALGAVAFSLSSYSVVWLYHPLSMVAMWIPGVVLGIVTLARAERRALTGLVVSAWAMAVSGHPETVAHTALLAAGLGLVFLAGGSEAGLETSRGRFAGRAAVAALLAGCFAAPALLPFVDVLPESERKVVLDDLGERPMGLPDFERAALLPLAEPLAFGSPRDGDWSGPSNFNEHASQYAGAAVLAIAVAGGLALGWRRGSRKLAAILAAGLFALLAALKVPPAYGIVDSLPLLGHAAHGRLRLFWVLAVAVVAGLAAPRLARSRSGVAAGLLTLAAVAAVVVLAPPPFDGAHQRIWWWVALAGLAAALAALVAPPLRRRFPAIALAVVVADLFVLGVHYHALTPAGLDLSPSDPPAALAWLVERHREAPVPFRVMGEGPDLFPNLQAAYGLWGARGNDPMQPRAPSLLVRRRLGAQFWADPRAARPARQDSGMYRMLGVRYLLTPHRRSLPEADWQLVLDGGGGKVWRLHRSLPLFFVPQRALAVADPDRARTAAFRTRDYAQRGVYLDPEAGFRGEGAIPAAAQEGRVWVRAVRPNGFELTARSAAGAMVASSVSQVKGWRLTIDGEPAETLTVNSGFVGFHLPPGVHAVSLDYTPPGWRRGWILFGLAALGCWVGGVARRRSAGSP